MHRRQFIQIAASVPAIVASTAHASQSTKWVSDSRKELPSHWYNTIHMGSNEIVQYPEPVLTLVRKGSAVTTLKAIRVEDWRDDSREGLSEAFIVSDRLVGLIGCWDLYPTVDMSSKLITVSDLSQAPQDGKFRLKILGVVDRPRVDDLWLIADQPIVDLWVSALDPTIRGAALLRDRIKYLVRVRS